MRALAATLACSALLVVTACRRPPSETEGKPSTLETTSASATASTETTTGAVTASKPVAPGEKPKPIKGPVDFALDETGVAIKVPAGYVITPSEIEGFWSIEGDGARRRMIAQIMQSFSFKTGAEHAKNNSCDEKQKNVRTTDLPGGGVMTTCEGASQGIQIAGTEIKTQKVRADFPIKEENRDGMASSVHCHHESDDAEAIAITKKVCASLHAVPVTHSVAPETKDLKPGALCFKDSNCAWETGCDRMECKRKSGGSHEKVCRLAVDHGTSGQACGGTRYDHMMQYFGSSPSYVPDSGKMIVCNIPDDNLFCDPATWTCARPAKLGAACGDKMACEHDTVCKSGTCVAAAKAGESCDDKRCVTSAKCDDKKICRTYTPVGAPCVIGKNDCEHGCSDKKCSPKPAPRQCSL